MADPASQSYWRRITIQYPDGKSFECVLNDTTLKDLDNPGASTPTMCLFEEADSDHSDVELQQASYMLWSRDAVRHLIGLYKEFESSLEDPLKKKKNIWGIITKRLSEAGFKFLQNKVESKWRSLIQSHKETNRNKSRAGEKRKSFQFYDEIDELVRKRHGINPPILMGNAIQQKRSENLVIEDSDDSSQKQSSSTSASRRREKRQKTSTVSETLCVLKEIEENRKIEHAEREHNKNTRAKEKNAFLKEILNQLKMN